jgi:hypothetical protein
VLGIFGVAEADEETALAAACAFSVHDGFEWVDVGSANLVHLFYLDGEPVIGEHAALGGFGADGEDAAIHDEGVGPVGGVPRLALLHPADVAQSSSVPHTMIVGDAYLQYWQTRQLGIKTQFIIEMMKSFA